MRTVQTSQEDPLAGTTAPASGGPDVAAPPLPDDLPHPDSQEADA